MPWGLENLQISNTNTSIYAVQSGGSGLGGLLDALGSILGAKTAEEFANATLNEKGIDPKYDFYLKRDIDNIAAEHQDKFVCYSHYGLEFTKKIATVVKAKYPSQQSESVNKDAYDYQLDKLNLTQSPQSAIAYCYNKNKRSTSGEVEQIVWYLPAIDEIEEITKGAYDEFDRVFQNNLYWSSQPAFTKNELKVSRIGTYVNYGSLNATFYEDDQNRARATYVYTTDGGQNWDPCSSEAPAVTKTISGEIGYVKITGSIDFDDLKTQTNTVTNFTSTPGNTHRSDVCRIRAVYRSGIK